MTLKLHKIEIVRMRHAMANVIGVQREYDFWHDIVLKTPEKEFIIVGED